LINEHSKDYEKAKYISIEFSPISERELFFEVSQGSLVYPSGKNQHVDEDEYAALVEWH
jgi:hypothetical protein